MKRQVYFARGPSLNTFRIDAARTVGLDAGEAREVLESGKFADEVRAEEQQYQRSGVQSVPAIIFDQRYDAWLSGTVNASEYVSPDRPGGLHIPL
jgi:predicted DsbA family dithiol-disulfide isomerase